MDPWFLPQLVPNKCGVREEGEKEEGGGGVALVDEKSSASMVIAKCTPCMK